MSGDEVSVELSRRRTGMSFQRTRMSADCTLMSVIRTSAAAKAAIAAFASFSFVSVGALAEAPATGRDADALAKQLSNPVAALISVPLQLNYDEGYGADGDGDGDGERYTLNIQPVAPFSISKDWNIISRTILPVISQDGVVDSSSQSGLDDTTQSLFFSPKASARNSGRSARPWLPSSRRKRAGPTAFCGTISCRSRAMTIAPTSIPPSSSRSWPRHSGAVYSKVTKIGGHMVSFAGGARYYFESPVGGPDWGLRFVVTLLYPK